MKISIGIFLTLGAAAPLLFTGCSFFGLYSESQVKSLAEEFKDVGFDEGRSHEIRRAEHERQDELARKQAQETFYKIPVPSHVNEDGVRIDAHFVPVRIITE